MPRLPIPGEDDGSWGGILNDYLLAAHEADGSLKPDAISDATTLVKGVVQLAGDLGGAANAPTVPGLVAKEDVANKGVIGGYAALDSSAKVPNAQLPVARTPVQLTDAPTVATDVSLGNHFYVTLTSSRTLGAPTNPQDGQRVMWEFIQGGSGSNTITLDGVFGLGTDVSNIVLTTTVGKRDYMGAIYNQTANKWFVIAFIRGY